MFARPACLFNKNPEFGKTATHIAGFEQVESCDDDRRLHDGVSGTVEPGEGAQLVRRDDFRLETESLAGVIDGRHFELECSACCRQHKPFHSAGCVNFRRVSLTGDNAGEEEDIVRDMKNAATRSGEKRGGLARHEGPQHEVSEVPGRNLVVAHCRSHRRHMRAAFGGDGGDEAFEDHGTSMIK